MHKPSGLSRPWRFPLWVGVGLSAPVTLGRCWGSTCLILSGRLALSRLTCKGAVLHRVQDIKHNMQRVGLGVAVRVVCSGAVLVWLDRLALACCAALWPEV